MRHQLFLSRVIVTLSTICDETIFPTIRGGVTKCGTLVCHLVYPKCVEDMKIDQLHSSLPLCRSYCNIIKIQPIPATCPASVTNPSSCLFNLVTLST